MAWIKPEWPAPANIRALTTIRSGGVSPVPYESFNLAQHVGDNPLLVEQNRQRLQEKALLPEVPRWLTQYHSTVMLNGSDIVDAPKADASYTHLPGVVLAILTADCLPILVCNKAGTLVAAIHAGWRGLLDGIVTESIRQLAIAPDDCLVWLGPAISAAVYEIGAEVRDAFIAKGASEETFCQRQGQWYMDLYAIAHEEIQRIGIKAIYGGNYCTYTDSERFFSYRRNGVTGRMASLIWMTPVIKGP